MEDTDSNESVDFLATLRQLDPRRVSDIERQYDISVAELLLDEKREDVSKDIFST